MSQLDTMMIFAARYSHTRQTGATYAVVRALQGGLWQEMTEEGRKQLLEETCESQYMQHDWVRFKEWEMEVRG
ncbi:MAG: hypothetical protein GY941_22255 [Planctomycetes bacterium]|nr:hypothetical protein [Planctomycetota bacterium]